MKGTCSFLPLSNPQSIMMNIYDLTAWCPYTYGTEDDLCRPSCSSILLVAANTPYFVADRIISSPLGDLSAIYYLYIVPLRSACMSVDYGTRTHVSNQVYCPIKMLIKSVLVNADCLIKILIK